MADEERKPFGLLIVGNPVDGFSHTVFTDGAAACEYAEQEHADEEDWWVVDAINHTDKEN